MGIAIAVLLALPGASQDTQLQAEYLRVHGHWLNLHLHEGTDINARLVFDPREHAFWIERGHRVDKESIAELPRGLRWYAFHITSSGIVERTFPVTLIRPRTDVESESQEEQLCMIAVGADRYWQFSFAALKSGWSFHSGTGNRIDEFAVELSAKPQPSAEATPSLFLKPQSPFQKKTVEMIKKPQFTIRVTRRRESSRTD
jgi:hypothetical protein